MSFSVSNGDIEWSLHIRSESVTLTVRDLLREEKRGSEEIPLAARRFLLFQRQDFLNNHIARVPITPNQEGSMEMGKQVPSNVNAQYMDTSGYPASDLADVKFYWENDQLI